MNLTTPDKEGIGSARTVVLEDLEVARQIYYVSFRPNLWLAGGAFTNCANKTKETRKPKKSGPHSALMLRGVFFVNKTPKLPGEKF